MKSKAVTFWLALFLGMIGAHRFYLGKYLTAVLWFFTSGLFGFGYLIDVIYIAFNGMKDSQGQKLIPPGPVQELIIKIIAVLFIASIFSFGYYIFQLAQTQPNHPIFESIPAAIDV